jgi:hypothetical protein
MKDTIVQEVREAREAVAADFGNDLHQFFAWAKKHATAEKKAKRRLPAVFEKAKAIKRPKKALVS